MSRARDRADGVLHNRTHEDTEGGRESLITFKGEQSGGEISTLAQIQASHDGTADDEKADLIFRTNDGSDGASPTERMRIDSEGEVGIGRTNPATKLHLQHNTSGEDCVLRVQNAHASSGAEATLNLTASGNNFSIINYPDADTGNANRTAFKSTAGSSFFTFETAATERMRIDDSGNLGIKTTSPVAPLHVDSDNGFGNILLSRDGGAGGRRPFGIGITGSADADLTISASADTDQAGAFAGDRVEIVRFLSGGGLTFNGDTASANALDDYEEGTWTPTSPTVTLTGSPSGHYTKIGRMVVYTCTFQFPSSSSGVQAMIDGLPFSDNGTGAGSFLRYTNHGSYYTVTISGNRLYFYDLGGSATSIASVDPRRFDLIGVLMTA